jgi:hypothetical protein
MSTVPAQARLIKLLFMQFTLKPDVNHLGNQAAVEKLVDR